MPHRRTLRIRAFSMSYKPPPKPPPRPSPMGRGDLSRDKLRAASPRATGHGTLLPPPLGEVAGGRRGLFARGWDVGCGRWGGCESASDGWLIQGPKPPPQPSPMGRAYIRTPLPARQELQSLAASYRPRVSFCLPQWGRWPKAGGGLFARGWVWGVGGG